MNKSSAPLNPDLNRQRGNAARPGRGPSNSAEGVPGIGEIKWFGGINGNTGRENDFGFVATPAGDLYFHRADSLSPPEELTEGTKVAFNATEGRKGKAAKSVQIMSRMDDAALADLVIGSHHLPPADVMTAVSFMQGIGPCEDEVFLALSALASAQLTPPSVEKFWAKFVPSEPKDRFFAIAPAEVKARYYENYFAAFRKSLGTLFSSVTSATTTLPAADVYGKLDERDELIAKEWTGKNEYAVAIAAAIMAKMLSARAAEKAAKWFYEGVGASVEDVSIRQLEQQAGDWTTHDLLIDSTVPVDVKNSRRPVSGANFYVEHTIPRFKLDRQNVNVRIAGVLSPYLKYENIQKPGDASFKIPDLIFLGETSRSKIDQLVSEFSSSEFEVARAYEKTFPNWVFAYPEAWYRAFSEDVRRFADGCKWPEGDEWEYVLDDSERLAAIPALCVAGKPLPAAIASRLSGWQADFYLKLQSLVCHFPETPVIFFAVLTDFLGRLKTRDPDFSPKGYEPILYPENQRTGATFPSYPLGAIDPLGLVASLIKTLSTLWEGKRNTDLERFSNFKFSGLGILQGRERNRRDWTTIIAYCGGIAYLMDNEGNVRLTPEGKPVGEKGKCGNVPLVVGDSATCPACGKLVCKKCGFCCLPCQERQFAERTERERAERQKAAVSDPMGYGSSSDPRWVEVPLEAYENDYWRR
jgi:cold shock CspA family protein